MSLAKDLYEAKFGLEAVEDKVIDFLSDLLGEGKWHDFTADHYDTSIEIYGVDEGMRLTEEQQAKLWEAGFDRCWTHVANERRDDKVGETYYWKQK